jgi:hypothetical protein
MELLFISASAATAGFRDGTTIITASLQTGSISTQTIAYNISTSQEFTVSGLNLQQNKWDVSVLEEWFPGEIPGADQYYASTSILLHFSGSDGSTNFINNGTSSVTLTPNNAVITSSQFKFGSSSIDLTGNNSRISISPADVFSRATTLSDFTFEGWLYFISSGSSTEAAIWADQQQNFKFSLFNDKLRAFYNAAGASSTNTGTTVISKNTWYHFAWSKNSFVHRLFLNGNQELQFNANSAHGIPSSLGAVYLGAAYDASTSFKGYLDDIRWTREFGRYTASFSVPTEEYPNSSSYTQDLTMYKAIVGGFNDTTSDYGVIKSDNNTLKIRKMSVTGNPVSGSLKLSSSVDRVYVNVLDYSNVNVTASYTLSTLSSSYTYTSSFSNNSNNSLLLNNTSSTVFATTGSNTFNGNQIILGNIIASSFSGSLTGSSISSSYALSSSYVSTSSYVLSSSYTLSSSYSLSSSNALSSSISITSSYALNAGSSLTTGSTYPITSSWSLNSITSSYALNSANVITVSDEGTPITSNVTSFNFVGTGVVAAAVGNDVTVTISGGGGSSGSVAVYDEGNLLTAAVSSLNFVGSAVTATNVGDNVTVTITGGGGGDAFPYTGSAKITGSLVVTGSINAYSFTGSLKGNSTNGVPSGGSAGQYLVKNSGTDYDTIWVTNQPVQTVSYIADGLTSAFTVSSSYHDVNQLLVNVNGIIQTPLLHYYINSSSFYDSVVLDQTPVSNSIVEIRTLQSSTTLSTIGFATSGSNTYYGTQTIQNGYLVLTQVSSSLNFVNDAAAASAGVPLGGLYRNGNAIQIRLS